MKIHWNLTSIFCDTKECDRVFIVCHIQIHCRMFSIKWAVTLQNFVEFRQIFDFNYMEQRKLCYSQKRALWKITARGWIENGDFEIRRQKTTVASCFIVQPDTAIRPEIIADLDLIYDKTNGRCKGGIKS